MAIKRVTSSTEIKAGQFVCFETLLVNGICNRPRKVLEVSGQRIYYADRHGEPDGYKMHKTALYVCDTEDEGRQLHGLSEQQFAAINEATKRIKAEFDAKVAELVSAE